MTSNIPKNTRATSPSVSTLLLLLGPILLSSCSSSSSSSPSQVMDSEIVDNVVSATAVGSSDVTNPTVNDTNTPTDTAQVRTAVEFNITVPALQSDSLQVRLVWGDTDVSANWIGEEFWTVTQELQSNTENPLVVTFLDNNGDIELASFESLYRTGSGGAETFQVEAELFDTEKFDFDGDGVSNLEELSRGRDPLVNEDVQLPVIDRFFTSEISLIDEIETRIPGERPYFEDTQTSVPLVTVGIFNTSDSTTTIDLDLSGTGTFFRSWRSSPDGSSQFGGDHAITRTNTGTAINWMGTLDEFDDGDPSATNRSITVEASRVDNGNVMLTGTVDRELNADGREIETISFTIIGQPIEESPDCFAISGVYNTRLEGVRNDGISDTVITKAPDDAQWHAVVTRQGEVTEEFLYNDLGGTFHCDFIDLE